ncbi:glycosyltransferase family 2 protein [Beijerinckia mobilis]|uniref:glycosyltransferase family 2 protein n=1 Tax=Beijerinckia mobilis TaxID=231434 RepID=UPI00068FBEB9|nr:glycosyltransferase family A protein [Beijerinckia mobilis]
MNKTTLHALENNVTAQFDLPRVSIIISNYNYARYLESCVDSVVAQTYSHIEIIIVDDKSTDDSHLVLDKLASAHNHLIIIKRTENGGQSAAALDGLARATGSFIVFLDADDILLPHAIVSHVHTHLSLRFPVGFTCADMLQIGGNTLMGSTSLPLSTFVVSNPDRRFHPRTSTSNLIPLPYSAPKDLLEHIYLVEPWDTKWAWSATSAVMFRRDALSFWKDTPGLQKLRYSLDAFFCYGVNGLCGSAIIDIPLAAYRIHGRNGFAARIPLNHIRTFELNSQGERSLDALRLLLEHAQNQHDYFRGLFWSDQQYKTLLLTLQTSIDHLLMISNVHAKEETDLPLWKSVLIKFTRILPAYRKQTPCVPYETGPQASAKR